MCDLRKEKKLRTVVALIVLFDVCSYFDNLKFTLILLVWKTALNRRKKKSH